MSRLFVAVVAVSIALGLRAGFAAGADTGAQVSLEPYKAMLESCATVGDADRDRCVANASVKDSAAGRQCEADRGRARRNCMLDFLEAKHPAAQAK